MLFIWPITITTATSEGQSKGHLPFMFPFTSHSVILKCNNPSYPQSDLPFPCSDLPVASHTRQSKCAVLTTPPKSYMLCPSLPLWSPFIPVFPHVAVTTLAIELHRGLCRCCSLYLECSPVIHISWSSTSFRYSLSPEHLGNAWYPIKNCSSLL